MREQALLELTTALDGPLGLGEALGAALAILMRELQAARGAFFVRDGDGDWTLRAARGFAAEAPQTLRFTLSRDDVLALGPGDEAHDRHGLALLVPVRRRNRAIAVLALGPRAGRPYEPEDHSLLRRAAACAATPIENGLLYDELSRVHRKLSRKAFELSTLFDVCRDLAGGTAEEAIQRLVMTSAMGHFLVSRCAIYLDGPRGLALAHGRGLGRETHAALVPPEEVPGALEALARPLPVVALPDGPLRRGLLAARMALVAPLSAGARVEGVLAIGERASGLPFSEEDGEMAQAIARQALAALETARLLRVREVKLRQDRDLQVAREIQQGLFPARPPDVPGFDVAARSRPCYEVGGDSYDWIPLEDGRLALVVADVAGKGTPASLLMAAVHASLHALAGTSAPDRVMERLNRFLFANTQASRFVTLFYAELHSASGRLTYVNAGHVPPWRVARDGTVTRLTDGGPALGLLAEGSYEVGEVQLEPGDLLAVVTDGLTEAWSPDDQEFGDDRIEEALRRLSGASASAVLDGLVAAVDEWAGERAQSDDLTALVLKAG